MLSCPNESTEEWRNILAEANGNRERALQSWQERGYAENEDLNDEIDEEEKDKAIDAAENDTDEFSRLIGKVKIFARKKLAMLQKTKVYRQAEKEQQYKRLIGAIEAAEGVESINLFVRDAYEKAKQAQKVMTNLLQKKEDMSRGQVIQELTAIADFANGYSILDEIDKADIYEHFSGDVDPNIPDDDLTPQQMLTKSLNIRRQIKNKYLNEGIPLMADFLLQYKIQPGEENQVEIQSLRDRITKIQNNPAIADDRKAKRIAELEEKISTRQNFSIDKRAMVKLLQQASTDESQIAFLMDPLISSEDSALALFAKAIKSQLEMARMMDIEARDKTADQFETYAKTTSASRDNVAKFNEGLYEELTFYYKDKETGKYKEGRKKMAFVQKYDVSAYEKAKAEFFNELGDPPILSDIPTPSEQSRLKAYNWKIVKWFKANKEAKPQAEIDAIISAKEKERDNKIISQEEYEAWLSSVMIQYEDGTISYKGELTQPAKKYINPKWTALYNMDGTPKNEKGKYHKFLTDMYFKAQEKLPNGQKRGYILPSIIKTERERLLAQGALSVVKKELSEMGKIQSYDVGIELAGVSGEEAKWIPTYYTQSMSANDVSLDLARSVLMFNAMANRYDALNQVNGEISLFKTIIGEREPVKTDSKGRPILDAFAKKLGYTEYIRQNGEPNSKKHLDAFIDMVIYGEMQKAEEILGLSLGKITNTVSGISAVTTIAADVLKGVANNLQGNIQMIIEANSGQFVNKKNLTRGKKYYSQAISGMLADFGKSKPTNLVNRLVERYDAMQGNFKDEYGKNVTGSAAIRLMRTNTLFFNQHLGEHEIQVSMMIALMDATKVKDKKTGEEISLFEAHQRYGDAGVEENTDFTEQKRQDFQNRLHALNKRMHGVYNDFDKGTLQRYSLGRLLVMYRKHLVPGYKRRFKRLSFDEELGAETEGFYRTFWDTFVRDLRDYKFNIMKNWSTYSPFEKAQIKRVIAELTIILSTAALIIALKAMADDDDELKKNWVYNFMLYEAIRMRAETSAYISPSDAYRVVKSPSAVTSTLERAIKFTDQFLFTWDPEKLEYQRKSGVWNVGDNKSWAYFLKLMGYSGYNITPEAAVESFEGTYNR